MKKLITIAFSITTIFFSFNLCFATVSPDCLFDTFEDVYSVFFYPPKTTKITGSGNNTEYSRVYDNEYDSSLRIHLDTLWVKVNTLNNGEWFEYGTLDNINQLIANNQCSIERCFGAAGKQCEGLVGQPPMTAHSINEITIGVSVGSIRHDNCCVDNPGGFMCGNGDTTPNLCYDEFLKAALEKAQFQEWKHTFGPYDAHQGDNLTIVPPREGSKYPDNERVATIKLAAPEGARLDIDNEAFCKSGKFKETYVTYGICGEVQPPIPDIKANGSDGPITIGTSDPLTIAISLSSGSFSGDPADWWIVVNTPSGWQYYDLNLGAYTPGLMVTYQGALFDLGSTEILNTSSLDAGTYTFYFGVDLKMNGTLNTGEGQLYYDLVNVTVTTVSPCTNIAGNWFGTETLTITCCLGGDCETETLRGTDSITIQQNGCNISYDINISGYGTFSRTGTIDGNNIQLSGIFAALQPWCSATQNVVTISGTVNGNQIDSQGTGIVKATCDGMSVSCTGNSTAVLTRPGSSSALGTMDEKEFISKPSSQLLNNYLKIFTTIAH